MKFSVPALIISVLCAIVSFVLVPIMFTGIILWARSEDQVTALTRNIVDEVIDTRVLTEDTLADFNLGIAAISDYYSVELYREVKVVNPDPVNPGKTYTSYMVSDNIREYNQGDRFIVDVKPVGSNTFRTIAERLMNLRIPKGGTRYVGRVR